LAWGRPLFASFFLSSGRRCRERSDSCWDIVFVYHSVDLLKESL
jgi:hypothetical protein